MKLKKSLHKANKKLFKNNDKKSNFKELKIKDSLFALSLSV
jgi:hypothetical protein